MLVALIMNNVMHKIVLPQNIEGIHRINAEKSIIDIEARDGKWRIRDNKNVKIISVKSYISKEYNNVIKNPILEEYNIYVVLFKDIQKASFLYCMPACEEKLLALRIRKNKIFIGRDANNDIIYDDNLTLKKHVEITLVNNRWMIENINPKAPTFVNNKMISNKGAYLNNGDVIFIMGMTIFIVGKDIFITNPRNKVSFNKQAFGQIDGVSNFETIEQKETKEKANPEEPSFKLPRVSNIIKEEKISIVAPPARPEVNEDPLFMTIGPSILMGIVSLVYIVNVISGIMSGNTNILRIISSSLMAISMLFGTLFFPIIRRGYNVKKRERQEINRKKKYRAYIQSKQNAIYNIMNKNREILLENYPSNEQCINLVLENSSQLLERKIKDYNFARIRLGIGNVSSNILISYSEPEFSLEDEDQLLDLVHEVTEKARYQRAPVVMSLVERNLLSIIYQKEEIMQNFLQGIMLQLFTLQNSSNLKLIFFLENNKEQYEYMKVIPHVWNDEKKVRFFADTDDGIKEIAHYLEGEFNSRYEKAKEEDTDEIFKNFSSYYVIVTDCYKKIQNLKLIREIVDLEVNLGFSIICTSKSLESVPNNSKVIINLESNDEATLYETIDNSIEEHKVTLEPIDMIPLEEICKTIANIPVEIFNTTKGEYSLPDNYTFLDMFNVELIEQLNVIDRWKKNDSTLSLKTPLGIDDMGMPIYLDAHEKAHGPHGLIAGSTGSGKSELIMTYILSLAVNYHPNDVNFVLIDYKGGGLAGVFEKKNIKLPHLVGTITNINTNELQRSLISIKSEVTRRQIIFNEVREKTDEGTIDIYKYQRLYHSGKIDEPLAHLFIISDEFAELKQQQQEFMDELISISRIGRSLGIHLILATQKPSGVVDEQIRSNSKFAICLKVQTNADSSDVIKRPDAAKLKKSGQFYLQVGNDEYFTLGQSGWAGAQYFPVEKDRKDKEDNSIEFIDSIGNVIKQVDEIVTEQFVKSKGEQITNIVEYLSDLAKQKDIKVKNLWLDNVGEYILLDDIKKKYNFEYQKNEITPVVGEYDDPYNQNQDLVKINFLEKGNTIIYGNAESGKETFLSTLVFDLITTYYPEEVNLYLLDFGSESLKVFKDSKCVGDVILSSDSEKVFRFFKMLQDTLAFRKNLLSNYGGDYKLYLSKTNKPLPMIVTILNNWDTFNELYNRNFQFDDLFLALSREGIQYGMVFVITANGSGSLRYRLSQNFKEKIALQLNKDSDFAEVFEKLGIQRPASVFGRGLLQVAKDSICEFQTARICEAERFYEYIAECIEKRNEQCNYKAPNVPVLPDKVVMEHVKKFIKDIEKIPVGISKKDLSVVYYNFRKNFINVIASKNIKDAIEFSKNILLELSQFKELEVIIFDTEVEDPSLLEKTATEFKDFFEKIEEKEDKETMVVINGIAKLAKAIDKTPATAEFKTIIEKVKRLKKWNFMFVDSAVKYKELDFVDWFKTYVLKENGIWVGDGMDVQYVITANFSRERPERNTGRTFGYTVVKGKPTLIKLLEMGEENDE